MSDTTTINNTQSFIERCDFVYNNGSHCYNAGLDFTYGTSSKRFCYDHLTEHENTEQNEIKESNLNTPSAILNLDEDRISDAQKSQSSTCISSSPSTICITSSPSTICISTSSCSSSYSCNYSSVCTSSRNSTSIKSNLISDETSFYFRPVVTSIQAVLNHLQSFKELDMLEDDNHHSIDYVLSSTTKNQQYISHVIKNEPIDVLPVGVVSDNFISILESTVNSTTKKRKRTFQNENVHTSITYVDIFASIATTYPLIQLNAMENLAKIQYLCVADLKISDYLHVTTSDEFNEQIKLSANGKYLESSIYTIKKEKFASNDDYRKRQDDVAGAAFEQNSFNSTVSIVKNNLRFEYLVRGQQIRNNIEYELELAKKQKRMEYKPIYDPSSFKIPDEHRHQIEEWLKHDFQKRIENKIDRSRCLFMIGPTQHGLLVQRFYKLFAVDDELERQL
ncbi:hypothetical protein I4U23_005717 [Adineta vaga]|nr:hypothetical protein I4U23_005717 [Adineta vaga]